MSRPLWNHQVNALRKAEGLNNLALFMDPGVGKTRTTIEILRRKYAKHSRLMRTIIFAPIVVCENWKREFAMFSKIHPNDIVVLTGTGNKRVKDFIRWAGDDLSRPKIFITNYHSTGMSDLYKLFLDYKFEVLVVDESQRTKNPAGKMAKAVAAISDATLYRYILTGTPVLNSPMDLFMQFRILDKGETFGKNFYGFRANYCSDKNSKRAGTQGYFPQWEVRPDMIPVIGSKIQALSVQAKKSECLDLPPMIRQEIEVALTAQQQRMLKEMKNEYLAFVDELEKTGQPKTVTAQIAATKALRLQQIVSGYAAIEQSGKYEVLKDVPRLKALEELLEDLTDGHKVIVWAVFKANYEMIAKLCEKMGLGYTDITGETKDKDANAHKFRTDPKCRVLIANPGAGGVGLNLVEASYSIYYSKGFSLEHDIQSEARNYRGGSHVHEKITRIDLIARGTIDEIINEALRNKQNVAEQVLALREKL